MGIYFTALSVARDAELRRIIRKSGATIRFNLSNWDFRGRISNSKNVLSVTKKITIEQGSESSSIDEKEIKEYIDMVITELK